MNVTCNLLRKRTNPTTGHQITKESDHHVEIILGVWDKGANITKPHDEECDCLHKKVKEV